MTNTTTYPNTNTNKMAVLTIVGSICKNIIRDFINILNNPRIKKKYQKLLNLMYKSHYNRMRVKTTPGILSKSQSNFQQIEDPPHNL